jgi:hypothetical protein
MPKLYAVSLEHFASITRLEYVPVSCNVAVCDRQRARHRIVRVVVVERVATNAAFIIFQQGRGMMIRE